MKINKVCTFSAICLVLCLNAFAETKCDPQKMDSLGKRSTAPSGLGLLADFLNSEGAIGLSVPVSGQTPGYFHNIESKSVSIVRLDQKSLSWLAQKIQVENAVEWRARNYWRNALGIEVGFWFDHFGRSPAPRWDDLSPDGIEVTREGVTSGRLNLAENNNLLLQKLQTILSSKKSQSELKRLIESNFGANYLMFQFVSSKLYSGRQGYQTFVITFQNSPEALVIEINWNDEGVFLKPIEPPILLPKPRRS